jgi:hypothetical protein
VTWPGAILAVLVLALAGVGITVWLIRRLWKQVSLTGKLIASLITALATSGALGTLLGLVRAFGAIGGESVDPSQKARILAEGISEAMNCTAFSLVVWVPSAITALVITRKRRGPPTAGGPTTATGPG